MLLVEVEVALHDWESLKCGCGESARHVADDLLRMARSRSVEEIEEFPLEGHAWLPSVLLPPAPAVASVVVAALADGVTGPVREKLLELLLVLVSGEGQDIESEALGLDLLHLCRAAATRAIWLLYAQVASGESKSMAGTAFEVLYLVEEHRRRLEDVRAAAGDLLPWEIKNGIFDD